MGQDFTVTITNLERKAEWEAILGTATVYIKSFLPSRASLPGHPDTLIYEMDLALLMPAQREKLVAHLATKFDLSESEVEAGLDEHGVPILATDAWSPWRIRKGGLTLSIYPYLALPFSPPFALGRGVGGQPRPRANHPTGY